MEKTHKQVMVELFEVEKKNRLVAWLNKTYGSDIKPDDPDIDMESLVLHESEFLKFVTDDLDRSIINEYGGLDAEFLSRATGVNSSVFGVLIANMDNDGVRSIVDATIGLLPLAKLALEYHGIGYFASIDQSAAGVTHMGEGYYSFCIC